MATSAASIDAPKTPFRAIPSALRTSSFSSTVPGVPLTPHRFSPGGSLHNTEDPLVVEIGSRFLRAGFAGEGTPRCTLPWTQRLYRRAGDKFNFEKEKKRKELWSWDLQNVDLGLVEDVLERGMREGYNKYLLIDSKTKKIVFALPPLFPIKLLNSILTTIFVHFQPPSIILMASPVLATVAAGLRSALVVDIGWQETIVTPVYELRAIEGRGVGVHGRCRRGIKVLKERWFAFLSSEAKKAGANRPPDLDEVEEIMESIGWCRAYDYQEDNSMPFAIRLMSADPPVTISVPFEKLSELAEEAFFAPTTEPSPSPTVPDDDDTPLPLLLYNALLNSTVDVRAACLGHLIVVGGGSNIPGLKRRVVDELRAVVEEKKWVRSRTRPLKKKKEEPTTNGDEETENVVEEYSWRREVMASPTKQEPYRGEDKKATVGEVKGVKSLGTWTGGSLLAGLKVKAKVELEREKYMAAVASGGTGLPSTML